MYGTVENYIVKGVLPLKKAKLLADVLEQWCRNSTAHFHSNEDKLFSLQLINMKESM